MQSEVKPTRAPTYPIILLLNFLSLLMISLQVLYSLNTSLSLFFHSSFCEIQFIKKNAYELQEMLNLCNSNGWQLARTNHSDHCLSHTEFIQVVGKIKVIIVLNPIILYFPINEPNLWIFLYYPINFQKILQFSYISLHLVV